MANGYLSPSHVQKKCNQSCVQSAFASNLNKTCLFLTSQSANSTQFCAQISRQKVKLKKLTNLETDDWSFITTMHATLSSRMHLPSPNALF